MTRSNELQRAILETLAYSDIFEYPPRLEEIHRYLPLCATLDEIQAEISQATQVDSLSGYYFLKGNDEIVDIRIKRAAASLPIFRRALFYGRILGWLPFVRMVALTGSLAVLNLSKGADMDYMLVTQPNHLWVARAFAVTFGRLMRPLRDRICVNLLVSENALAWPIHDLYSAREMCQMIPIVGMDVYNRLRAANPWTESILPNSTMEPDGMKTKARDQHPVIQKMFEFFLRWAWGEKLEEWAMKFQLQRIARRSQSDETNFSADVCQGNFHNHRKWAGQYLNAKLISLGLVSVPMREQVGILNK